MIRVRLLLVFTGLLAAGEPLVCRGFDAATATQAVVSTSGRLLALDPGLGGRRVWFALAGSEPAPARQALAHAIGCWWTSAASGQLTRSARLATADASVRTFPPLPFTPAGSETLLRRVLDPWLGGNGGLALDTTTRAWNATASPGGLAQLEQLLAAMADPAPRAPHLLPADLPTEPFARSPRGADLGGWSLDLAACAGVAVALASDCDPAAPAPIGTVGNLREAVAALAASGLSAALHHGCLGIGVAAPLDRLHPAERAAVAVLPIGHLCRDDAQVVQLSAQLGARVAPSAWDLPGWTIAPLAWRRSLLVVADVPSIHQVMTALEAADQIGLEAWLR
jgi:hypothetical protein